MANDFFGYLGFASNPFENNTAEREPDIASYAVRPPYLDRVLATSSEKGIFVLTGSRGSGKSATRLTVAKSLWNESPRRLVVPLIGYNVFRPYVKSSLPLELYANQIAFLAIEQILGWLSAVDDKDSDDVLNKLNSDDKTFVRKMLGSFYLNRSENARKASAEECFRTLDISIVNKSHLWVEKRWDQVSSAVITLASRLGEKYFDLDIGDPKTYAELLRRQQNEGFIEPIYVFSKVVELARIFGFSGVTVHIDKVDETDWTTASVDASADLIYPLLSNIQLHEIDGLTWTFFLWDKVKDALSQANNRPVRWDKIPDGKISWSLKYLTELVARRFDHFSAKKLSSLSDICDETVCVDDELKDLAELAESSPRSLVTLLDIIVSEHSQTNQHDYRKLDQAAFHRGMDVYALKSIENSGFTAIAEQIAKVKLFEFSTSDVASRFGKGPQTARAQIDSWASAGLVKYTESRVGAGGGRPVDYFAVNDSRLRRIINRNL